MRAAHSDVPAAPQPRAASGSVGRLADVLAPHGLAGPVAPALRSQGELTPANALLATLVADVAREPQRWRWQRAAGEVQPMTDALQRWLAQLAQASAGAWRRATPPPPQTASPSTPPATAADAGAGGAGTGTGTAASASARSGDNADTTLRLLRDGELQATLRLTKGGVWAESASRRPAVPQIGQPGQPGQANQAAHAAHAALAEPVSAALKQALAEAAP